MRLPRKLTYRTHLNQDIPAWWLLKKKKTMFHTGDIDARSVRTNMTFLLSPLNSAAYIKKQEPVFHDIKAFLFSLEAPRYPFAVDKDKAARGEKVFGQHCAKCHGKSADGRMFAGPSLVAEKTTSMSSDDLRAIITNGRKRMPKFSDKLKPAEIDALVDQIKALKK